MKLQVDNLASLTLRIFRDNITSVAIISYAFFCCPHRRY